MMEKTRTFLVNISLPAGDAFDLPTSQKRFPSGAHFGIEVPTISTMKDWGYSRLPSRSISGLF